MNLTTNNNTNTNTNTNVTTDAGLSPELRTYYSDYLVDLATPACVHRQFGQKVSVPRNKGQKVNFRRFGNLAKATTPLTEGVTPDGQKLTATAVECDLHQYGSYLEVSDFLELTAVDNIILQSVHLQADQSARTLDTNTREVLNAGTNVQYGDGTKSYRYLLAGGESTGNDYLTVDAIKSAVRTLKRNNCPRLNGEYVGIIHPDVAFDLTNDPKWVNVKTYSDPKDIYQGEIGKLEGVRFVESTEAKIFHAADLTSAYRTLTVDTVAGKVITLDETITSSDATKLAGRYVLLGGVRYQVASATTTTMTLKTNPATTPSQGDILYPGEAGAKGRDIYSTLILGADAYGVTELEGHGLEVFVKQLGSAGTADPMDQRATIGWKATTAECILAGERLVRVETASTSQSGEN